MEKLEELVKKIDGNVLTIGYNDDSKVVKLLTKNKHIDSLFMLSKKESHSLFSKNRKKFKLINKNEKNINIKKLKKELKKYKFDYLICDFDTVLPFFRGFIKNSILVAEKKVFIETSNDDYNGEEIKKRYSVYGCKIEEYHENDKELFVITTNGIKVPFIKSIGMWFRNMFYDIIEFIGNIMIG